MSVGKAEPERYRVRDLVIDVDAAAVTRGLDRIALPPRTFELLVVLARRHPALVRRHDLLEAVWPDEHVCDETLSHRIMVLRRALGDRSDEPSYVVGERGFGYRLLGPVARLGPGAAQRRSGDRRRGVTRSTAILLAAFALVILAFHRPLGRRWAPSASPVTITVRPLVTPAGSGELASVAMTLTGAIQSQIRRLPGIRVVPEGGPGPRPQLRVEGTVSGTADDIEVFLRLIDHATGIQAWSQPFQGSIYEVLASEETTAWRVAQVVHERFAPPGFLPPAPDAASPAVRRLCLRGELAWLSWTEEGMRRADAAWLEAVRLDHRHAPAHAGCAQGAAIMALLGYDSPDRTERRARAHARRAVELDAQLPAAHAATGFVKLLFDRDVAGAEASLRHAADLDPDDLPAIVGLALVCQARGRYDESLEYLEAAAGTDPGAAGLLLLKARAHQGARRANEAVAAYERLLRLEPGFALARRGLAESLAATGRDAEALAVLRKGGPASAALGASRDGDGREETALDRAWQELCRTAGSPPPETVRACVFAADRERAVLMLTAGVEGRWPFVVFAGHDPLFESLRGRPAFEALGAPAGPAGTAAR